MTQNNTTLLTKMVTDSNTHKYTQYILSPLQQTLLPQFYFFDSHYTCTGTFIVTSLLVIWFDLVLFAACNIDRNCYQLTQKNK